MAAALLQSFSLNAAATLWHSPLATLLRQRPAAIIRPQCRGNPVAFTSGRQLPCCNHSASMLWQPCGIYLWLAAALLQSFGLNAVATLWHLPLASSCPAAIIQPQHRSNPVAFISGHIAMAVPCCNHSASTPQQPCGIDLWPHCYGGCPAAIIWPQCQLHKALLPQSILI